MHQKPPLVVSALAAALSLLTVPVGVLGLAVLSERLGEAFDEGGVWMWIALGTAGVMSVLAGGVVLASSRWKQWLAPVAAIFAVVVVAVAAAGYRVSIDKLFQSLVHVSAADRELIVHGGTGEAYSIWVFGLLLAASMLSLVAGGFAIDFLARFSSEDTQARRLSLNFSLAFGALGLWLVMLAGRETAMANAEKAFAHVNPADKLLVVFGSLSEKHQAGLLAWALLALAIGFILAGAVMLRESPRAIVSLLSLLAVPAVVTGARALSLSRADLPQVNVVQPSTELVKLEGPSAERGALLLLEGGAATRRDEAPFIVEDLPPGDMVSVDVGTKATAESLQALLETLFHADVSVVELRGVQTVPAPQGLELPASFTSLLTQSAGARVQLIELSDCRPTCDFLKSLDEKGMALEPGPDEGPPHGKPPRWGHEPLSGPWPDALQNQVAVRFKDVAPLSLMRGAVTAAKRNARLAVVFE